MADLQATLNYLAGTTDLASQGAANVLADTEQIDLVGAINTAAGTTGLEFNGAIKALAVLYGANEGLDSNSALLDSLLNFTFPNVSLYPLVAIYP